MKQIKAVSVEEYIALFPTETQKKLASLQRRIKKIAPTCVEGISYGMPAYKYRGKPLVYFAAYTEHIGVYATPVSHAAFSKELKPYKQGKGSVQFPLNEALPLDLIEKMIRYRKQIIDDTVH